MLILVLVDYEKAFYSVKRHKLLDIFLNIYIIIKLFQDYEDTKTFNIERAAHEFIFKGIDWNYVGIDVNGHQLTTHLHFANDLVLITNRANEANNMLSRLE